MVNNFCWILIRWYFFTYIFLSIISSLILTLESVTFSFCKLMCIKWTVILNVDTRKILITYNIIIFWYIQKKLFTAVKVWVNGITPPLLILHQNLHSVFSYWQHKLHIDLFFFCKTVPQYNQNKLENWEYIQCH